MKNRDCLCDWGYDQSIVYENLEYDEAIMGITLDGNVLYDYNAMVELLMTRDGMTEEECHDWLSYNVLGLAIPDSDEHPRPLICYKMEDLIPSLTVGKSKNSENHWK